MKRLDFYFDFVSPYAYLGFELLPQALAGLSYQVNYKPVLLGALLKHHGQSGPLGSAPKRAWIVRHGQWLAHQHGLEMRWPEPFPFNSLPLLRLALAASAESQPNRWLCEAVFRHVWTRGGDPLAEPQWQALVAQLAPAVSINDELVKNRLRTNTEEALQGQVFGVPTWVVEGQSFWGQDALPMLRECVAAGAGPATTPA